MIVIVLPVVQEINKVLKEKKLICLMLLLPSSTGIVSVSQPSKRIPKIKFYIKRS